MLPVFRRQVLLWILLLAFGPVGAQAPLSRFEFEHQQMGTLFRIIFYASDSSQAANCAMGVFHLVDSFNRIFSDYQSDSELNRLCATHGQKVAVSTDLWKILRLANQISKESKGAFDVSIGPLSRLWRRARHLQEMPESRHIEEAVKLVNYRYIRFYKRRKQILLAKPGMQLDLGGIAQGYAADACLEYLKKCGYPNALVDAGGDIALGAPPPNETGWKIEVPIVTDSTEMQMTTLLLSHCGITSSGAKYKYLEFNGIRYSHIIDPRTGYGLTHRNWVTVMAPNAVQADVWATALSVDGYNTCHLKRPFRGVKFWVTRHTL